MEGSDRAFISLGKSVQIPKCTQNSLTRLKVDLFLLSPPPTCANAVVQTWRKSKGVDSVKSKDKDQQQVHYFIPNIIPRRQGTRCKVEIKVIFEGFNEGFISNKVFNNA